VLLAVIMFLMFQAVYAWAEPLMGGIEAARLIRQTAAEATLVAVSGDAGSLEMQRYQEYQFTAALAKPFSIDAVEEIVRRFL